MIGFRKGIISRSDDPQARVADEQSGRGWWPFSYLLLAELARGLQPGDGPVLERLYRSLAAGDGIFKITRAGRFADLDREVAERLADSISTASRYRVHDVATSSGITAAELHDTLAAHGAVETVASDYYDRLAMVRVPRTSWQIAVDADGRPIQATGKRVVVSLVQPTPWRYFLNRFAAACARRHLPTVRQRWQAGKIEQSIPLFHPDVIAKADADPTFSLRRHDLMEPTGERFDLVRAMNILSVRHLSTEQLQTASRSLLGSVRDGGHLLVGRNVDEEDGRNRATLFRCGRGTATVESQWNGGAEIEQLILEQGHSGSPSAKSRTPVAT